MHVHYQTKGNVNICGLICTGYMQLLNISDTTGQVFSLQTRYYVINI